MVPSARRHGASPGGQAPSTRRAAASPAAARRRRVGGHGVKTRRATGRRRGGFDGTLPPSRQLSMTEALAISPRRIVYPTPASMRETSASQVVDRRGAADGRERGLIAPGGDVEAGMQAHFGFEVAGHRLKRVGDPRRVDAPAAVHAFATSSPRRSQRPQDVSASMPMARWSYGVRPACPARASRTASADAGSPGRREADEKAGTGRQARRPASLPAAGCRSLTSGCESDPTVYAAAASSVRVPSRA